MSAVYVRQEAEATGSTTSLPTEKAITTLKAKFALLGHELHVIRRTGGVVYFEVRKWGQTRTCSTLHDLESFLVQVGGRP